MAIPCFKFGFEGPESRVYLGPHGELPHHGEGSVEDAMRTEAGRNKLAAKEKVETSKELLPDSVRHLNELIEKATPSQAEVILDNLDAAITQLSAIEDLKDMLDEEGYQIALAQFDKSYSDFVINPTEVRELAKVRLEAGKRIDLMEAHKVTDIEKLKAFALLFVRDSEGKQLDWDQHLKAGENFTIDFRDPKTGLVNPFAQEMLTLGMVLQAVNRKEIFVSNRIKGRPDTMAYLWPDGRTYNKPAGYTGKKSYVEILQGYKLATPAAKPAAPTAPVEEPKPEAPALVAEAAPRESYTPGFVDGRDMMSEEDYARAQAEEAAMGPGTLMHHRPTEVFVGPGAGPDADLTLTAELTASTPEIPLDSLKGQSVLVPEHFRGETSYEQIAKIKHLKNGQAVYDAIRMMAAIHREVRGPIDNRNMWENLRGGLLSKGGHWEIAFNEMAKAVYGKNENNINDSLPFIKEFKAAAKAMLDNLDKTEGVEGVNADSYKEQREGVDYSVDPEKRDMARVTDQVFDRNSYGPPVALNVFQSIAYGLSKKDRPVVTPDTWTDKVATSRGARGYKVYGEQEVISHARAFDKMMTVGSQQEYLTMINNYMAMGESLMGTEYDHALFGKKVKFAEVEDVPPVTAENLADPNFKLSEAQIQAVRYGAMYFAAAELGVYQKVEAEKKTKSVAEIAAEFANNLAEQVAMGERLNQEQKAQLESELNQKFYGVLSIMASMQPTEKKDYFAAGIEGGLGVTLLDEAIPGRLSLQWTMRWDQELGVEVPTPIITTGPGVIYSIDLGKNKRWHADAYAKFMGGLDENGELVIGPTLGGDLGFDATKDGTVRITVGGSIGLREDGNLAGAHLSLDRNLSRVLQKKVAEFRGDHAAELDALRTEVYAKIDALDVDPVQKEMLKVQYEKYMDYRIAYDEIKDFTKWYHQIKLVSVGVTATVDLKGGFAFGPYITIGIGFRAQTLYVPPLETPEQVAHSMQTGLPTGVKGYKAPEADWIKVEVTDEVLWDGDAASLEAAQAQAEAERVKAFETISAGVADDVEMTEGDTFTDIEFKNLNGTVRLYTDGSAGIETIQDGPDGLALNLDSSDDLIIRILEIPAAQGGDNVVVIGITNNPSASLDDIVANSGNYLAWNQTLDGKKSNSVIESNPGAAGAESLIFTRAEAEAKLDDGSMVPGDLTKEGAKQNVRHIQYEDLRILAEREVASERFSEEEKAMAETVAGELIAAGFGYKKLILSDQKDKIHAKIIELYAAKGVAAEEDKVKLAHQYAMEKDRPQYKNIPLEWNNRAFKEIAGNFSTLATDYWAAHEAEMKEGGMRDSFPEGSEFMVTINEKGEVIMLGGYYNKRIYGEVLAPVKWDATDPEGTLATMGVPVNEENKAAVIGIAEAIAKLDWEEKPLEGNADFNTARKTMVGDKLLTTQCSNDLYGPEDGARLREMARSNNPNLYPDLAKEFAEDVAELLAKKQAMIRGNPVVIDWEVYSGLDDNCFNLSFARNVKLVYKKPEGKEVKAASTREKVETGMTAEMSVKYNTLRIAPGLIPIVPGVGTAGEEGTGREGGAAAPGDTEDGDDATTEHPQL